MSRKAAKDGSTRGGPRKGAGRPETGRNLIGPKISAGTKRSLRMLSDQWDVSEAECLERAVTNQMRMVAGIAPIVDWTVRAPNTRNVG